MGKKKNNENQKELENKNHIKLLISIFSLIFGGIGVILSLLSLMKTDQISNKTIEITENMNEFNINNANLNYSLELSKIEKCKNTFIEAREQLLSIDPFVFDVIRNPQSGLYFDRYFAHLEGDDISLKKIENNMVQFIDMEASGNEELPYGEAKNEKTNSICSVKDKEALSINYASIEENYKPYGLFHIIFRGYNKSNQFFTIVVYNPHVIADEEIYGEVFDFLNFEVSILEDADLYDRKKVQDIVYKINSEEVNSSIDLIQHIEFERNLIRDKLVKEK